MRLLLSSEYRDGNCPGGNWLRKSMGVSSVPVAMLPEDRTLVALQREIEEKFSMKLPTGQ
jgi:hypothetical protein